MARILIAEDDESTCALLEYILTSDGHEVRTATDGLEAVEMYHQSDFDLICLDLDMPRLNGIAVTRKLRADAADGVPILMITASPEPSDLTRAKAAGISALLPKPFLPAQLRERVAHLLGPPADPR